MTLLNFLLITLLQDPANLPTDAAAPRAGSVTAATDGDAAKGAGPPELFGPLGTEHSGAAVEVLPLDELRRRIAGGEIAPVPRSRLQEVLRSSATIPDAAAARPQIRAARYSAVLSGTHLESGTLQFDVYDDRELHPSGPLLIGLTSLQHLTISGIDGSMALGADSARRLFLLESDIPRQLNGTWTSEGLVAGDVVTFRLELPWATTSRLELTTAADIQVTGVGSLVLPVEPVGATRQWTIIPGDISRLTFSCRLRRSLASQDSLSMVSFSAGHVLTGDIFSSRWTLALPPDLSDSVWLMAHVAAGVRISDVSLDDQRPVEWQVVRDNGQQILQMILPESAASATLIVSAASLFSQAETWDLPMLSMSKWQSMDGRQKGPVLVPIGQISVRLPPSIGLDEWVLIGIQERDVVTSPDQSREYQLTQYLPEASAMARTSVSVPQLTDSIVTIVEPAGRLATVRCLVNVVCEESPVVELQWPVSPGWKVIAARYASNSRALFFESQQSDPVTTATQLTVHLPETLEPGASRVIEIQLQQSDTADSGTLSLPLAESPEIGRAGALAVFPPAFSLSSDLQRHWSAGRRSLTIDEIRQRVRWFPESRLAADVQAWDVSDAAMPVETSIRENTAAETGVIRREHAIRFDEGKVVESSRLVLPPGQISGESIGLLLPASVGTDLRWLLDGEPVAARREELNQANSGWTVWHVPLAGRGEGQPIVILCQAIHTPEREFTAAIPWPETALQAPGTLQLFSSGAGLLEVSQLAPETESGVSSAAAAEQSTVWRLPDEARIVRVRVEQHPRIEGGQTIDIQMLHLIGEHSGGLEQDVLAIANVSHSAGQDSLPLSLPDGIRPLVLVNGHRVHLRETPHGLAIPLPPSSVDSQVLLTWSEPAERPDDVTGERRLPRLFVRDLSVPQCTHHVLLNPDLELRAAAATFAASEPTDVIRILDRLLNQGGTGASDSSGGRVNEIPAEVRRFVSRWQLNAAQGWQPRTLIDTATSEAAIPVEITQTRRRTAITAGAFMLLMACSIGLRQTLFQYRLTAAGVAVGLLGASFCIGSTIVEALLRGAYWGLTLGLLLVMFSRWKWQRRNGGRSAVRVVASVTMLLSAGDVGLAWQQPAADVFVPEMPIPGSDIVYVRRELAEQWQRNQTLQAMQPPQCVVKSLRMRIVADDPESIELNLALTVAAVSGDAGSELRIPLLGSHLVECLVDGRKVLPEPDGVDAILVPVPASVLVKSVPLGFAAARGDSQPSAATGDDEKSGTMLRGARPAEGPFVDESPRTIFNAGPHAAFTVYSVECRLRPVIARQATGVQFRLPGIPCPAATIEIAAPVGVFSEARAQNSEGLVRWNPVDGEMMINGLAVSDGIDVRLFRTGAGLADPQPPAVDMLAVSEAVSGRQLLTCVCRFSKWNPLLPEVRYRLPTGYELLAVSVLPVSPPESASDAVWSVTDQRAAIMLPENLGSDFMLSLQLRSLNPLNAEEQLLPVSELQQFEDCKASPKLLLAVRANPVFSVLPIESVEVTTAAYSDVQSAWGQWLRRSDSLFRVPAGIQQCRIRLSARTSVNEVHVAQEITLHNSQLNWMCRVDIETSVLPVFRHRVSVSSEVEISEVQVAAGEANRLASWHRRGDQLLIELKEGTTGLHGISIKGRQTLRPDDLSLTLPDPRLQNSQVLESSLTLTDVDGLGLVFAKLGGAIPDQPIGLDEPLVAGSPVRLQIVREAEPIELRRVRPVKPFGAIAAIRSADQITFVMHVTQWSGSLGPLELNFSDGPRFVQEPVILAEGQPLALVRESGKFTADQDAAQSLFDQPEFTVLWTMPIDSVQRKQKSASFEWPVVSADISWSEFLLVPLDAVHGIAADVSGDSVLPGWLSDAAAKAGGQDLSPLRGSITILPLTTVLAENRLTIPMRFAPDQSLDESGRGLFAVADTIVWTEPHQSAVGETVFLLFAQRTPARCTLRIPTGTVVMELESDQPTRWEDASRANVIMELTRPVTVVRMRWLSERAGGSMMTSQVTLVPPFTADCETKRMITVASPESQQPVFTSPAAVVPDRELASVRLQDIRYGLDHARPVGASADLTTVALPTAQALGSLLADSRLRFLKAFEGKSSGRAVTGNWRPAAMQELQVSIGRSLQLSTLISLSAGLLVLVTAAFSRIIVTVPDGTVSSVSILPDISGPGMRGSADRSSAAEFSLASDVKRPLGTETEVGVDQSGAADPPINIRESSLLPETAVQPPSSDNGRSIPM